MRTLPIKSGRAVRDMWQSRIITITILIALFLGITTITKHKQNSPQIITSPKNSLYLYETSNETYSAKIGSKESTSPYVIFNNKNESSISFFLYNSNSQKIQDSANRVIFRNAQENTDVIYSSLPNGIKEEIVIHKATTSAEYIFKVTTSGAHPRKIGTNAYSPFFFDDKNNYQFHFEKPFAIDANGNRTEDISFNIRQSIENKNTYQIQLTLSEKWLSDKSRKYPITIDPTVVHDTSSEFATGVLNRVKDTGSGSVPSLETYYQENSSDLSTVALWHFNEVAENTCSGGQDACDVSGNLFHGTATGTSINTTSQRLGAAARTFNGTSDKISAGSNIVLTNQSFTVEAWAKRGAVGVNHIILGQGSYTLNLGLHFGFRNTNVFTCAFYSNDLDTTATYTDLDWHHWACTYDAISKNRTIFRDGIIVAQGLASANYQGSGTFYLGADVTGISYFNGSIDEVRISRVVRTSEEIKLSAQRRPYSVFISDVVDIGVKVAAWNSISWNEVGVTTGDGETLTSTTNLISQWNLNSTSGTTATSDAGSCGSSCNLTLTNFASTGSQDAAPTSGWTSDNKRWGAGSLMFDITNDRATCSDANCGGTGKLDFGSGTSFSLETWFNARYSNLNRILLAKRDSSVATNAGFSLVISTTGQLTCRIGDGANSNVATTTNIYADSVWHHVVCVINRTAQTISIYVDGKLDPPSTSSISTVGSVDNSIEFSVGTFGSGGTYIFFLDGILDSIKIYSRALNSNEVMSNYNSGNIDLQTRVGSDTTPDDGSWEEWRPITNETVIDNVDNPLDYATPSASIFVGALISTSSSTFPSIEGTKSLHIKTGVKTSLTNVVALWHLDETGGSGAYIKDSTANARHGTPTGTAVVQGISSKARSITASTDAINITGEGAGFSINTFSATAWVKLTTAGTTQTIIDNRDSASDGWLFYTSGGGVPTCRYNATDVVGATTLSLNTWYHLACTSNGATLRVYINGVESNNGAIAGSIAETTDATIGARSFTQPANVLTGVLDEVMITSNVLSVEEIAEMARLGRDHYINKTISSTDLSGKSTLPFYVAADRPGTYLSAIYGESGFVNAQEETNVRGLWHLEEHTGTSTYIKDVSGLGNNLSVNGTSISQGKIGKSRYFNGTTTDYLSCTDAACGGTTKLDPSNTSRSMGAWVKTSKVPQQFIMTKGQASTQRAYALQLFSGGSPRFTLFNTVDGAYIEASASAQFNDNNWHYIVGTYDGTTASIYVDSILQATSTTKTGTQVTDSTGDFQIGARTDCTTCHWNGQIDEPFVFATSLTAEKIRQTYEMGLRTHNITIDFSSAISHDGPLSNSSDLTFTLMATPSGTTNAGDNIFEGDKIIVKENVNGTEYIAQGTVDSVNISTGATTVSSWDGSSTFPSSGFTPNATVFKWQREYWTISEPMDSHINAITNLTLKVNDGNEGRFIWLDDLRSNSTYLTTPGGSAITSSIGNRYMQYRIVNTSYDFDVSATVSAVTVDYTPNVVPNIPTLDSPTDTFVGTPILAVLKTTATDTDSDYLRYKIQVCTNVLMSLDCQTFDQTVSQTGWSGQNTQTSTAYTSGTQATYTLQSPLDVDKTYYWRSYAIDPNGVNSFGSTQATPFSFHTNSVPNTPSLDLPLDVATGVSANAIMKTTATDDDSDYLRYKIEICTNIAMSANCQTFDQTSSQTGWSGQNTQTSTAYTSGTQATYTVQSSLLTGTTYYWRSYAIDPAGLNTFSATQGTPFSFTTATAPAQPSACTVTKNILNTQIIVNWTDNSTTESGYQVWRIVDGGAAAQLGSNLAPNTVTLTDSSVSSGHSYGYLIRGYTVDGASTYYSNFCVTASSNLNTGFIRFEGIKFN